MQKLSQKEERSLIAGAQGGSREAMERIVTQYLPLVLAAGHQRFARPMADDATGAAAEELVRAVLAFDLAKGVPFAAFAKVRVYGAVSHACRKAQRVWAHESAPCAMEALERVAESDGGGRDAGHGRSAGHGGAFDGQEADAFAAAEARVMLAPLLSELPADERRVLALLFADGCSTYEAARRLGTSQSSVVRTKRRALAHLRTAIEGGGGDA